MKIRTILVPTDFSPDGEAAVDAATELARQFDAEVVVLHAYHIATPMAAPAMATEISLPPGFLEQIRDEARDRVEKLAAKITSDGVKARGIATPEPASFSIVEHAKELPADLIVIGTRGNTGLKHVLLGSVAERVVRTADCPVLTVKAKH